MRVFTNLYYLNLSRTSKISRRDKNHSPCYYNRPRGPLGGSGTPRGSIVQLCMYYVCISILYCPFIDYVEVGETKIDAVVAKNAPEVPRGTVF